MRLGHGLNIGGWISQSNLKEEHIASFFTEADVARIASWGFRHIRLPFDYPLLERDDAPGEYLEQGFAWIDRGIAWAHKHGLQVVLDMHKAPGFTFANPAASKLLTDAEYQQRFFRLWQAIARRYRGIRDGLVFELLNEIVAPDAQRWNDLAAKAVAAIREVDPERTVVVGSNRWNAASTFAELAKLADPHVIYTFHFYEPFFFTHQKAGWVPFLRYHGLDVPYPGKPPLLAETAERASREGLDSIAAALRGAAQRYEHHEHGYDDLRANLAPVLAFRQQHKAPVYCGEFGVIDVAPAQGRLQWHADMVSLFAEHDIDWSLWTYKAMDFGIVDRNGLVVSERLLDVLLRCGR